MRGNQMASINEISARIKENVQTVIIGKTAAIELLWVALLCEGHVLLEDVPGVGKTMLARAMAVSMGGVFKRLQCTPDLLPNDVTGISVFNQANASFEFRPGPVFVNVLLADEINRATPRTQSALLEAMQEQQVTLDGITHQLPRPFIVLATQNPIEYEGTFPLPEAQLDRFMLKISMGYPSEAEENQILIKLRRKHPINDILPVITPEEIINLQPTIWDVNVDETVQNYIIKLVAATRQHGDVHVGGSPRASLALYKASQALAAIRGRDHVLPDDVKYLFEPVLLHRLIIKPESELRGKTAKAILQEILNQTAIPMQ